MAQVIFECSKKNAEQQLTDLLPYQIKAVLEYPDRRIKFIVLTMCSSGMRIEGWNYLRWRNIKPIERNGQIVAAKIVIYEGDAEEYYSFITAETYFYIKDWMDYRKEAGEPINGDSWIVRDIWNFSVRGSRVLNEIII